jgi:hypothetical protein
MKKITKKPAKPAVKPAPKVRALETAKLRKAPKPSYRVLVMGADGLTVPNGLHDDWPIEHDEIVKLADEHHPRWSDYILYKNGGIVRIERRIVK